MEAADIEDRLTALRAPWVTARLVEELVGVEVQADAKLAGAFRAWAQRFLGAAAVERMAQAGLEVDRHALETYLSQNGFVSWKWAGVYYGVTGELLQTVVARLEGRAIGTGVATGVSDQVVRQREAAQLHRLFPSLRHRAFSDHSRMCRAFHDAIRAELGLEVTPLLCVTSQVLEPQEPDIAAAFDAITLDPVGLRYQVWLNTNKPVHLRPDVCSLRFYAQHEQYLRGNALLGNEPGDIDDRLRAA